MRQAFIVVMHGNRKDTFGLILANDIVIQHCADILGGGHAVTVFGDAAFGLFTDDIHAELDAVIADENGGSGDELAHLVLALAAEGAVKCIFAIACGLGHALSRTAALS